MHMASTLLKQSSQLVLFPLHLVLQIVSEESRIYLKAVARQQHRCLVPITLAIEHIDVDLTCGYYVGAGGIQ